MLGWFAFLTISIYSPVVFTLKLSECIVNALGMESGDIRDSQISASSSFDAISVGPQNARIRKQLAAGAWCPFQQIRDGAYEFLQITFDEVHIITDVETQGRFAGGAGKEFATHYMIDYLRTGSQWMRYKYRNSSHLIEANKDVSTAIRHTLDPPIIASRIRLVPYSYYPRTVCLRTELYGCQYKEGLLFYSMNYNGSQIGGRDFHDNLFENTATTSKISGLSKGLGLLSDGQIAMFDPLLNSLSNTISEWVGWNQSETNGSVELTFEFDEIRQFSYVELWTYKNSLKKTEITFSTNGKQFSLSSQISSIQRKSTNETELRRLPIRIPLHGRRAIAIKMILNFTDSWLFLSEISFSSKIDSPTFSTTTFATNVLATTHNPTIIASKDNINLTYFTIFFIGSMAFIFIFVCIFCTIIIGRLLFHEKSVKKTNKLKTMIISMGDNGFSTSLSDQKCDFAHLHCSDYKTKSESKSKPPSWSNFHFPPPPSEIYENSKESPSESFLPTEQNLAKSSLIHWSIHDLAKDVKKIDAKSVKLGPELGRGRFTIIRSCIINDKPMAAKVLNADHLMQRRNVLIDEAKILSHINHPNIIKIYGIDVDCTIYLELLQHGNIRDFIRRQVDICYLDIVRFINEIVGGMEYLEQEQLIHGHLSPQCILVDLNLRIKIASPRGVSHHAQLRYSAPESIIMNEWSCKGDVWSFAITVWELLGYCKEYPFGALSNKELLDNARQYFEGSKTVSLEFNQEISKQLVNLLKRCWYRNPFERPNFHEIQHFFSQASLLSIGETL